MYRPSGLRTAKSSVLFAPVGSGGKPGFREPEAVLGSRHFCEASRAQTFEFARGKKFIFSAVELC
ncbi:MAG: hypothetical protein BAA03_05540 [Caldibacillus debilis]|nr:MAG: hypothetical protein BAA03_05540 [Caldibacillus debilis]